jgi:hypothetical protein
VYLRIAHATLDEWEIGNYTYNSTGPTITRIGAPLSSSNAGAAVNFSAGTKNVFHVMPADAQGIAAPVTPLVGAPLGTDTTIIMRGAEKVPYEVTLATLATFFGSPPTAPAAFTDGQWTAEPTLVAGEIGINPNTIPAGAESIQYRVGTGGTPRTLSGGATTGLRVVTQDLSAGVSAALQIRAINTAFPNPDNWSDVKNRTPLAGGGGAAAYIAHTQASGAGTVTGTLPAGVTATDTLLAIVYNTGGTGTIETMAAPSGWTARTGVVENARGARAFTAPGNVGTLTFTAAGAERLVLIGLTAPLRDHAFAAWDFDTPGQIANQPTPSVTAVLNDVCVSVYIQVDDGAGGALPSPGTPQASYTRQLLDNTAAPRVSILSRASMPAGATGTISHDANANFATRFTFTGVFGS